MIKVFEQLEEPDTRSQRNPAEKQKTYSRQSSGRAQSQASIGVVEFDDEDVVSRNEHDVKNQVEKKMTSKTFKRLMADEEFEDFVDSMQNEFCRKSTSAYKHKLDNDVEFEVDEESDSQEIVSKLSEKYRHRQQQTTVNFRYNIDEILEDESEIPKLEFVQNKKWV